ncbi:unnamed protein product [Brugia timori]|uniref:Uncharacterized protein n=1 Tax=Brugia timori TaxID=42155 RepID=A0A0R3QVD9_9BILA|nr:unnamed protein product [Brugia timori]
MESVSFVMLQSVLQPSKIRQTSLSVKLNEEKYDIFSVPSVLYGLRSAYIHEHSDLQI